MASESDVANTLWITQPFLLASLFSAILRCVRNPTVPRFILVSTIVSAIINNMITSVLYGGFDLGKFSVYYFTATQVYTLSIWLARLYVCLRMSKLLPSPALSTAFHNLAYVVGASYLLTTVAYIADAIEFYNTQQPIDAIPDSVLQTTAVNMAANLMFEITSVYLHFKSLKMFASKDSTGLKLYIISCSTLTTIVIGVAESVYFMANDALMDGMMAGLQCAVLPASIVLGEAIAVRLGKRLTSKPNSSQTAISSLNKSKTSKIALLTATLPMGKESPQSPPTRQPADLAQPSI